MRLIKAYLTIDDIASNNTKAIVDYLSDRGIQAVLFVWGERVESNYNAALYALKKGMILGNHSYTHPFFSELSLEEGIADIKKCEAILDKLYKDAGLERRYRLFRFPYDDKGGENKESYQQFFREHGFSKLDDRNIVDEYWTKYDFYNDIDTFWSFDFEEYNIRSGSEFTKDNVLSNIDEFFNRAEQDVGKDFWHIFIIHAHDETEELVPEYYKTFIDEVISRGVHFEIPKFISL